MVKIHSGRATVSSLKLVKATEFFWEGLDTMRLQVRRRLNATYNTDLAIQTIFPYFVYRCFIAGARVCILAKTAKI